MIKTQLIPGFFMSPVAIGDTVVYVSDPTLFSSTAPFDIGSGGEIMRVTAISSVSPRNAFTVTRAVFGVATAHQTSDPVWQVMSDFMLALFCGLLPGGVGATGTPLTGLVNAIPTGNTSNCVDPTSGDVTVQLQNGAADGETKNFLIINSSAHDLIVTSSSDNILSFANGGTPMGKTKGLKYNGISLIITFTWVAAANNAVGAWVTG
jgi:hypothetical protein